MNRTHTDQDVYVGDTLAYQRCTVVENGDFGGGDGTLRVRARDANAPARWNVVVRLIQVPRPKVEKVDKDTVRTWTGVTVEGETLTVTAIPRARTCCSRP